MGGCPWTAWEGGAAVTSGACALTGLGEVKVEEGVEGVGDLLLLAEGGYHLATAGDRLRRHLVGEAANLPLLLPLLRLLSPLPALLPLLLSRHPTEALLPEVLLPDAV